MSLPGCRSTVTLQGQIRLLLWGNLSELIPASILPLAESMVELHQNAGLDADLTLKRGRIVLTNLREDRAAAFFGYLVRHTEPARLPALYVKAIEALGAAGGSDAVSALKVALNRGQWWTPFANRRHRSAAAQSLRRIGTPEALDALRDSSRSGALGVRAAARAELARVE